MRLEPADRLVPDLVATCRRCGLTTHHGLVVCGWWGEEVGICVLCGGDLRNGREDGWTYRRPPAT